MRAIRSYLQAILGIVSVLTVTWTATATTTNVWNQIQGGAYSTPAHWTPANVPGPGDWARFDSNDVYTVTFSETVTNEFLRITAGQVTFDLGGHTNWVENIPEPVLVGGANPVLIVRNGNLRSPGAASYFRVGQAKPSSGMLIVTNDGRVTTSYLNVGVGADALGTLIVSGSNAVVNSLMWINLGESRGLAEAVVANGGRVEQASNAGWNIAYRKAGQARVTVTGEGTEIVTGHWTFGRGGTATGRVEKAATVTAITGGRVGGSLHNSDFDRDNPVTLVVTGPGSRLTYQGAPGNGFFVGGEGTRGTLVVEDGGLVECTRHDGSLFIMTPRGALRGAGGTVKVNSKVENANLVAPGGAATGGTLAIEGNYEQTEIGTLRIRVADGGDHDRLTVDGDVSLDGTLEVAFPGGAVVPGVFDLLTATGDITGSLDVVIDADDFPAGVPGGVVINAAVVAENGEDILRLSIAAAGTVILVR